MLEDRYHALWTELTAEEEFSADEMWRIEQRIERLNDLGFDVEELDIVTDFDGDQVRIQPKVVELGHHRRELQSLTGLNVEDAQARRMLNDIAAFTAHFDLGREDRMLVANRWMNQIYEPIMRMVPPEARGKLEPAEIFHEILVHRWYLSGAGRPRGRHLRGRPRLHRQRAHRRSPTRPSPPTTAERRGRRGAESGCPPGAESASLPARAESAQPRSPWTHSRRRRRRDAPRPAATADASTPVARSAVRHPAPTGSAEVARPITMRWIWLVPSKIWVTLASRNSRSTGYSRV